MDEKLYKIVEYILNIADPPDLEVIQAALEKRLNDKSRAPVMGLNPAKMAAEATDRMNEQLGFSKKAVTDMAVNFVEDIIRKNAPELSDEQVKELMSSFLPESAGGIGKQAEKPSFKGSERGEDLPPGMIIQMIQQFIEYSENSMSAAEQVQMETEIPGWKEKYWKSFPGQIQKLISLYLNGDIDRQRFDSHVCEVLGL